MNCSLEFLRLSSSSLQGTLTLLAAMAEKTEVAPLLSKVVLLCPIAFLGHITSEFLRVFSRIYLDTVSRWQGDAWST
jgi:hypothetical protein